MDGCKIFLKMSLLIGLIISQQVFAQPSGDVPSDTNKTNTAVVPNTSPDSVKSDTTNTSVNQNGSGSQKISPDMAWKRLEEGNQRFAQDKAVCPDRNQIRREATQSKQKPFAVILGCSDSRVDPSIAFDQGIGDLFVVRLAGNVVDPLVMDSIEYSALYNGSVIVVVLGHENCGAVEAVLNNNTQEIESIAERILPGIRKLQKENKPVTLKDAIIANIQNSVSAVKRSPIVSALLKEGRINVVGAYYDLATGKVMVVPEETNTVELKKDNKAAKAKTKKENTAADVDAKITKALHS